MCTGNDVGPAITRALDFLERSQLGDGSFAVMTSVDPAMTTGCTPDPSVFPTALIAQSLGGVPAAAGLLGRALDFLTAEQDKHGLWRHWTGAHPYCRQLPPDLDDTCCASHALQAGGRSPPKNREILLANRQRRGLFQTWVTPRLRPVASVVHWRATLPQLLHAPTLALFFRRTSARPDDVDAVVNANTLHYLGLSEATRPVADHLLDILRRNREGHCDKWYENPFAIWYFFSRALHGAVPEASEIIIGRLDAARPENMLETALALLTRLNCGDRPGGDAITALLAGQMTSGAWPRAALYHGGRRRLGDGSFAPPHPDTPHWGSEELTTAFCIQALIHWQATIQT